MVRFVAQWIYCVQYELNKDEILGIDKEERFEQEEVIDIFYNS